MDVFSSSFFADSRTDYETARYVIFGVPYDATTSFRPGTRFGPRAIREISYNFESYVPSWNVNLADIPFTDLGDLDAGTNPDDMTLEVQAVVQELVQDGKIPIMLGGEHSITPPAVRAVKPEWYVVCDAHLDLREDFRGSVNNHACSARRVFEDGIHNIIIIGGRSGTAEQFAFARDNLALFTADDVKERGIGSVLSEIKKMIDGKRVYFSIDADVIDCCLTPGLGTPEPFGLTPHDVRGLVTTIAPHSVAFDYVEVCPPYDHGQAATVAGQMVREFIAANWVLKKSD